MLTRLKRLLGWDTGTRRRASPAVHPRTGQRPALRPEGKARAAVALGHRPQKPQAKEPDMADLLGAPSLSLETQETDGDGFDPYNTGVFDRSASWDRINKRSR